MIDYLRKYQLIAEFICLGILFVIAAEWWHHHDLAQQQIGYDKATQEYQAKDNEKLKAALAQAAFFQQQLQKANEHEQARDKIMQNLVSVTVATSGSLQNTIDSIRSGVPTASLDALRKTTDTLATVFADCQSAYREMGQIAQGHANDVQTLMEAWPSLKIAQ